MPIMKTVICTRYGPPEVLKFTEIERPIPKDDEVLIRVRATTVHIGDTRIRRANPFFVRLLFGLNRPKKAPVLGMELSGEVASVGKKVTEFRKRDEVFAFAGFGFGAYAEYICLPGIPLVGKIEKMGLVAKKPKNLTFGEAAAIPSGALTTLKVFQKVKMEKDDKILINGASGSLGTYAIQMANSKGMEVTGVCSGRNEELVLSLGAVNVIDYTKEDFTKGKEKYDIIFDAVGKTSRRKCSTILKKGGSFLTTNGLGKIEPGDLNILKEMIEGGRLKPVIDRTYRFEDIVEAHRYVDKGHKRGNVVISGISNEM
jgi:NADPH:quinone reductase-like Zn-dependent oxidoreductase